MSRRRSLRLAASAQQARLLAAVSPIKRPALAVAVLCAALAALALAATPAFAERTYDSQISGFVNPVGVTVDSADHVWVSDTGNKGLISEYDAYPSQTLLSQQNGEGQFECGGSYIVSLAVGSNGDLYAADSCVLSIDIFEPSGYFLPPRWTGFGSNLFGLYVATDNSGQPSDGRVYLSTPEETVYPYVGAIKAFDPNHNEVNFTAAESYVSGSEIIGTPSGYFGSGGLTRVAVDDNGNIYAVDQARNEVDEFESSGKFVRAFTGAGAPGSFSPRDVAIDPANEDVLIVSGNVIDEFSSAGTYLGQISGAATPAGSFGEQLSGGIAVNSNGYLYVADRTHGVVDIFTPRAILPKVTYEAAANPTPTSETLKAKIDPRNAGPVTKCEFEYGLDRSYSLGSVPCSSSHFTEPTDVTANISSGLTSEISYHYRVVVSNSEGTSNGKDRTFTPHWVPNLTTESATNVTSTGALLHGSYIGNGDETEYYFEYGTEPSYGATTTHVENGSGTGPQTAASQITGLQPLTTYHYRIVATNTLGTTYGEDQTVTTPAKPSIDSLTSSNLTVTTAVLHTRINPQGAATKYRFEYGITTNYGSEVPIPEGEITGNPVELSEDHSVEVQLTNLQAGATYHFRVVAENPYGTTDSEDQAFGFHPPNCPNAHLRQITNSSSLPDCRAYELVSPANAGGTVLFPEGPNSAEATNPARFAFGGILGEIQGTGSKPSAALGDLYVATRTDQGWVTKYVGPPGTQTFLANGPPDEFRSNDTVEMASPGGTRTDTSMSKFLDWIDGVPLAFSGLHSPRSFSPHVWSADGSSEGEWPTVPGFEGSPIFENSADFTHYVFQTGSPPSLSLIDNNTVTNVATEVSNTGAGPIPIQPGDTTPDLESLRIPAVSRDGSHILIAARAEPFKTSRVTEGGGLVRAVNCGLVPEGSRPESEEEQIPQVQCPLQPSQLYMRVDDAITYEIAPGHAVKYVGETPDGSKVFFTSEEHLTAEDPDHGGASLYMWSIEKAEEGEPLTLISKGETEEPGASGNTANCHASWTAECGVMPFVNESYSDQGAEGYVGGNGLSDNSIASQNGDVYFFSPEKLTGPRGVNGQENLYDYHGGTLQYVATFPPQSFCTVEEELHYCSAEPVIRMQVTPNDGFMAFLTASQVTSYNNAAHTEMYRYEPSTEQLICVSCLPNGKPPTTNVYASSNGLFMTNDGRTFFSTGDSLVPTDTDGLRDVYEYVEGHQQLISSGTSTKETQKILFINQELHRAGLVGVSADGTNVYFSTYDTLVGQDQNVNELKFYDARTDGGFPYSAPPAPCEAADECHGPGGSSEAPPQSGSGAELGTGGNLTHSSGATHHKRRKKHRKRRHSAHQGGRR